MTLVWGVRDCALKPRLEAIFTSSSLHSLLEQLPPDWPLHGSIFPELFGDLLHLVVRPRQHFHSSLTWLLWGIWCCWPSPRSRGGNLHAFSLTVSGCSSVLFASVVLSVCGVVLPNSRAASPTHTLATPTSVSLVQISLLNWRLDGLSFLARSRLSRWLLCGLPFWLFHVFLASTFANIQSWNHRPCHFTLSPQETSSSKPLKLDD